MASGKPTTPRPLLQSESGPVLAPWGGMKTRSARGRFSWVALPTLFLTGPQGYACGPHPLAELSREMTPGLPFETALDRFEAYVAHRGPEAGGDALLGTWVPSASHDDAPVADRILFIQDLWRGDDLILTTWFDPEGLLQGKDYRCEPPVR